MPVLTEKKLGCIDLIVILLLQFCILHRFCENRLEILCITNIIITVTV